MPQGVCWLAIRIGYSFLVFLSLGSLTSGVELKLLKSPLLGGVSRHRPPLRRRHKNDIPALAFSRLHTDGAEQCQLSSNSSARPL
jgi:hypothetical protein